MASIVAMLLTTSALADVRGKLVGKVTNKKGEGIVGAEILLVNPEVESQRFTVITKKDGKYSMAGLDPILFNVTIKAEGYLGHQQQVKVRAGIKLEQDFELTTPEEMRALTPLAPEEVARNSFNKAIDLYQQKSFSEAIIALNEALEKNPALHQVYMVLGDIYYQQKNYEQAVSNLDKAIANDATLADAFLLKGNIANDKMDRPGAIENWTKYAELKPDALIYYNIGALWTAEKQPDKAIESFTKATELKSDYADAFLQLGRLYLNKANHAESKKAFNKYLELRPEAQDAAEIKELISIFP